MLNLRWLSGLDGFLVQVLRFLTAIGIMNKVDFGNAKKSPAGEAGLVGRAGGGLGVFDNKRILGPSFFRSLFQLGHDFLPIIK